MLETETDFKYTNKCISNLPFVFIARPKDPGNGNIRVVMLEITKEQEEQLDEGKSLSITKEGLSFSINPDFCLAYGEFDFSPNSDDIKKIDNSNYFDRLYIRHFIPSVYDYENHCVHSNMKNGQWFDTDNIKTYLPYLYACINKPKRICIFKEYIDTKAILRAQRKAEKKKEWRLNNKEKIRQQQRNKLNAKRNAKLSLLTFKTK